uniref:Uncharacterized protein n=1 Tax=Rhizophora mucronata TaxID=61149 RepID=A0A2P2JG12_RHIMU
MASASSRALVALPLAEIAPVSTLLPAEAVRPDLHWKIPGCFWESGSCSAFCCLGTEKSWISVVHLLSDELIVACLSEALSCVEIDMTEVIIGPNDLSSAFLLSKIVLDIISLI